MSGCETNGSLLTNPQVSKWFVAHAPSLNRNHLIPAMILLCSLNVLFSVTGLRHCCRENMKWYNFSDYVCSVYAALELRSNGWQIGLLLQWFRAWARHGMLDLFSWIRYLRPARASLHQGLLGWLPERLPSNYLWLPTVNARRTPNCTKKAHRSYYL